MDWYRKTEFTVHEEHLVTAKVWGRDGASQAEASAKIDLRDGGVIAAHLPPDRLRECRSDIKKIAERKARLRAVRLLRRARQ